MGSNQRSPKSCTGALPRRSLIGLSAANFFQAEMVGVILPVMNAFLSEAHWRYGEANKLSSAALPDANIAGTGVAWEDSMNASWMYPFIILGGMVQTCGAAMNAQLLQSLGNRWLVGLRSLPGTEVHPIMSGAVDLLIRRSSAQIDWGSIDNVTLLVDRGETAAMERVDNPWPRRPERIRTAEKSHAR